jgi:hypothetical protein
MRQRIDALLAVHQDVPLSCIVDRCREFVSVVVLTTHKLFPTEAAELRACSTRVELLTFAELLDDLALVACDERATRDLEAHRCAPGYDALFRAASLAAKNEAAHRALEARYAFQRVFYSNGLGVSGEYWAANGGITLDDAATPSVLARARELASNVRAELSPLSPVTIVDDRYVFFGSTKRLHIRPGTSTRLLVLRVPVAAMRVPRFAAAAIARRIERHAGHEWQPCTTIHEYRQSFSSLAGALGRELLIVVDGYHPSNYPRAYLDMYRSGAFVAPALPSARWFEQFGRRVLPPLPFQRSEQFALCEAHPVRTVLLVMNHAGDWTALINRSDTDVLVEAFTELARARRDLRFILRLHPTMATPQHEGVDSIERVRRFVAGLRLENLEVSRATLDEDLARAELYLSEYSQVLIDAWRSGRVGVAVNLTQRRSFMADYERFGFPHASTVAELGSMFDGVTELAAQQNRAVVELNRLQAAWEAP